ncbi:MAG TPA: ribonuclease HII [Patescibacteria group bacterium]|nr:ribonuclease HII [Patescibacteria group bacterium]
MNYDYEKKLKQKGYKQICGLDEAGRGPLAGPLVAGAVILDPQKADFFELIKDSKALNCKKREIIFEKIKYGSLAWSVGVVGHWEINKHGLSYANKIAMKRAWKYLEIKPDFILSDYMAGLKFVTPFELIKSGDSTILSVAAASIVAKVFRDQMMLAFAKKYPDYGFEKHKGYGTKFHLRALDKCGPCEIHRTNFKPVKEKLL